MPTYRYAATTYTNDVIQHAPGTVILGPGETEFRNVKALPSVDKAELDAYMAGLGYTYVDTLPDADPGVDEDTSGEETEGGPPDAERLLLDFIDAPAEGWPSGMYRQVTMGAIAPSSITWWSDSSSSKKKVVETVYTRNAQNCATTIQHKMYGSDGTSVLSTVTDTVTYAGIVETGRVRAIA